MKNKREVFAVEKRVLKVGVWWFGVLSLCVTNPICHKLNETLFYGKGFKKWQYLILICCKKLFDLLWFVLNKGLN
jgi:hypothetical protein